MANPNEYTPQQYQEAARKWAKKLGLLDYGPSHIDYWPVIDWIALYESGWRGIQSEVWTLDGTIVPAHTPGAVQEDSWGPFQLHREGVGAGKLPKELLEPDTNAELALKRIKERLDEGYGIDAATNDWSVTHGADMEWVLANPGLSPAPGQAGTAAAAPVTTGAEGELVRPRPEDFINPLDYWTALSMYEDIKAGPPSIGPDEIDFINASIDLIAQQMSGELIDVQKADLEIGKRISALTEAGKTYRELAKYALPEGAEFIPGGGPGGIYEKIGVGQMPASTTYVNPLATALVALGPTPEMGPTPEASFEAALAGARQLQEGMGAAPTTTALAAPPSHLEAALATAGAPAVLEPEVEPPGGWMTPAPPQPAGFPGGPPLTGAAPPMGPGGYQPYEPPVLSPEEANRIAAIILAILGSFGGGGGQPLATPTPMPSGAFEQALRGR